MSDDLFRRPPTRREFLTYGTGVFLALSLPRAFRGRPLLHRRSFPVMGTLAELQVAHRDERTAQAALDAAIAELRWVERTMTRFDPASDIGRVNSGAARDGVRVTAETGMVVAAALRWASLSEGRFDPALGSASELWDVLHRRTPPAAAQVDRLARRGFWRKVDVDQDSRGARIRFDEPDLHLDLGAIAKGYGIDRAVTALRGLGIGHALVTVGGDLFAVGSSPTGDPWEVGIRDPHDHQRLAGRLTVADRAVTTSGDYERYFDHRGVRYHHLIDPATAAPRRSSFHSATVTGTDCLNADAASTAVFGLDADAARALARRGIAGAEVTPLT